MAIDNPVNEFLAVGQDAATHITDFRQLRAKTLAPRYEASAAPAVNLVIDQRLAVGKDDRRISWIARVEPAPLDLQACSVEGLHCPGHVATEELNPGIWM